MKLEIDEKLITDDVTLGHLDDLDFSQNITLEDGEANFIQWYVEDNGDVSISYRGGPDKPLMSADLSEEGFAPEEIVNAFKSFFVCDDQWLKKINWDQSPVPSEDAIMEDEWQTWDVLIDDETPATVLCNVGIADVIDNFTEQFVLFALTLQSPDKNGLVTEEEQKFCEAIETEIATFVDNHQGASVGEITAVGVKRFYTYNNASEEALGEFLTRIEKEFSCSLACEIESDPEKIRYWSDLYPEEVEFGGDEGSEEE